MSYLLDEGADIESVDNEGKTPLMNAIYSKHKDLAKLLIGKGANVNVKEPNGWSPLMFAIMHGQADIVKSLIKAGADVNAKTKDGETALQRAEKIEKAKLADMKETITTLKEAGAK
jgi:ankyrin repeat protein